MHHFKFFVSPYLFRF